MIPKIYLSIYPSQVELGTYTLLLLIQVRVGGKIKLDNRLGHDGGGAGAGRRAVGGGRHAVVERAQRNTQHVSEAAMTSSINLEIPRG